MVFGLHFPRFKPRDFKDTAKSMVSEVQKAKQAQHTLAVTCELFDGDSNSVFDTPGLMNDCMSFLKVPLFSRVHIEPHPYWKNGKLHIKLSKKYHGTINLKITERVANALNVSADVILCNVTDKVLEITDANVTNLLMSGQLVVVEVKNIHGQMNFDLWDNDFSSSFCHAAHCLLHGHFMEFILSLPNRQYLLSMALTGAIGIIFGFILAKMM